MASSFSEIQIFANRDLLEQAFLSELRAVINASYRNHEINPIGKIRDRLQTDTQIANEVGDGGFTAIAWAQDEIVGTASVKKWDPEGFVWKSPGRYTERRADALRSLPSAGMENGQSDTDRVPCDGDFEVLIVAVKPGERYRKRGIAESLVKACEEELQRRYTSDPYGLSHLRVMLKVVPETNGRYWLKKGFRVVGEAYCPPFTWDLADTFILWAMRRELEVGDQCVQ
jgi:ribosomal protein S18 acetylase RimI-like enzyme